MSHFRREAVRLEQAPAGLLTLPSRIRGCSLAFAAVKLSKTLHLLEDQLKQLLAADDLQVSANLGILLGKLLDLIIGQLNIEEEDSSRCQFGGSSVKKHFRAVTHLDDVGSVAQENSLTCYIWKSSTETSSAATVVTFNNNLALAGLINECHNFLDLSSSTDTILQVLHSLLAVLKLLFENIANVVTSLDPLPLLEFNLKLVRLDAVFHLITSAVESFVQNGGSRFHNGLSGEGVGSKTGVAD
ncbi:hypothetical protein HG530_007315 [Fusarium avenaceum]|nr:hypothetical protein HG530_007315 [Fusarium avenaceum]